MKKKFWSKAMALLMTLCMVISMCPLTAFAAETEGTKTRGDVEYAIGSLSPTGGIDFVSVGRSVPTVPTYYAAGDNEDENYALFTPGSDGEPDSLILHNATVSYLRTLNKNNLKLEILVEGNNHIQATDANQVGIKYWHQRDAELTIKGVEDAALEITSTTSYNTVAIEADNVTIDGVAVTLNVNAQGNQMDAAFGIEASQNVVLTNGANVQINGKLTCPDAWAVNLSDPNASLVVDGGSRLSIQTADGSPNLWQAGIVAYDDNDTLKFENSTVSLDGISVAGIYAFGKLKTTIKDSNFSINSNSCGFYASEPNTIELNNSTVTIKGAATKAFAGENTVTLIYEPCRSVTAGNDADSAVIVPGTVADETYANKYVKVEPAEAHEYGEWTLVDGDNTREKRVCARCGHTEYREAGTIILQSDNVTITSATGTVTLDKIGASTTMWQKENFTFSVTPAEGYAVKTSDFAVKYDNEDGNLQTLTANSDGTYTIPVSSTTIKLYVNGIERQYTVNFDTNGGSDVNAQKMFSGSRVEKPIDPNREGYHFAGWYSDADCKTAWNFGTDTVTEDVTLYAKWIPEATAVYTASGTVTGNTGEDMSGAIVKLMQGDSVIAAVTTDVDGTFTFANLPAGNYNITAEKGARGVTASFSLTADTTDITLKLPAGNIKTEVKVDENTPNTYVSGLDALDEVYAPTNTDVVRIVLNVASKEESDIQADADKIKALSGNETLSYLDMNIKRYVNGADPENITDTGDHIQAITIDYDTARKSISVYRVHGDAASKLTVAVNEPADGTYRVNDGSITIYTTKFSTYAIGYTVKSSGGHSSSNSSATTYPVDVKSVTNGTIKVDKSVASKGSIVTITVAPDKGYELGKLTVIDKNGKTISVTAKGNGQYTFTMPDGKVTVAASFAKTDWNLAYRDCLKDNTCPIWPFTDAKTTDWYHDGVHFCLENKLMVGYGANTFKPDNSTSRAMLTVMLWRLSGSPTANAAMPFSDVDSGKWYTEAVHWAASNNVVTGFTDGTFRPDAAVTREQMAAVIYRYAQSKNYDVSVGENTNILSYADAESVSEYAITAMQWACGSGMIQGADNRKTAPLVRKWQL